MRVYRTFHEQILDITLPYELELSKDSCQHLLKVLRLTDGEQIHVVDNSGGHYIGTLQVNSKKSASVFLTEYVKATNESPLEIHLYQVISKGDRMEYTIEKAVELGVTQITPLFSERCEVTLTGDRKDKKVRSWQNLALSACLQSYRDTIPQINQPLKLDKYLDSLKNQTLDPNHLMCNLNPFAGVRFKDLESSGRNINKVSLLIGPEGGLSDREIELAKSVGYQDFQLGPRVLRTETASLVVISILQSIFGDI